MTSGYSAQNTLLIWNYRKLLELTNLSGPSQTAETIDMTSHDSADGYKEFIAGLRDGGEISIEGNFVPSDSAGQIAFHTDLQAGTRRTCWIVMPMSVGGSLLFTAMASGFEGSYPMDSKISISGALKVSGKPTLYVTASTGLTNLVGIEENGGGALSITPAIAGTTYAYACSVNTASSYIKLTPTAAAHTIYVQGTAVVTGNQSGEIALGAAGTTTDVFIMAYSASASPKLYKLTVTRP